MAPSLNNRRGQTSVEYLLLMSMAFITAYIIVTKPLASFTRGLFANLQEGIQNLITNAEWSPQEIKVGTKEHPTSKQHFKAMHL